MLGKLFKHEWKASIRVYGMLYILAAIFTGVVLLYNGIFRNFTERLQSQWLRSTMLAIEGVLGIGYILVLLAVNILTLVYLIYRFYQTMVCDEAYLTHTLPVTTGQLIFVKSIMAFCFQFLSILVTIASFLSLIIVGGEWNRAVSVFSEALQELKDSGFYCGNLAITTILFVLLIICSTFFSILVYYMCISAGNLFNSRKLLGSVVVYLVFNVVLRIFSIVLVIFGMWTAEKRLQHLVKLSDNDIYVLDEWINSMKPSAVLAFANSYLVAGLLLIAAGCVALFAVSRHLLKNKLNLA